jgi:hypothetical protein
MAPESLETGREDSQERRTQATAGASQAAPLFPSLTLAGSGHWQCIDSAEAATLQVAIDFRIKVIYVQSVGD